MNIIIKFILNLIGEENIRAYLSSKGYTSMSIDTLDGNTIKSYKGLFVVVKK